jgi:hypothetical protein
LSGELVQRAPDLVLRGSAPQVCELRKCLPAGKLPRHNVADIVSGPWRNAVPLDAGVRSEIDAEQIRVPAVEPVQELCRHACKERLCTLLQVPRQHQCIGRRRVRGEHLAHVGRQPFCPQVAPDLLPILQIVAEASRFEMVAVEELVREEHWK